jgi:pimeloyl-ACP methyl ester carboxylesterase
MATFAFIHGAGGSAWDWHLVTAALCERGHRTVTVDLPCEDDSVGLVASADVVVDAVVASVGAPTDLVVVAQSLGAYTAPLVCERLPVDLMVLLAAMTPVPGESAGDWWANTGHDQVVPDMGSVDPVELFCHDVAPALQEEAFRHRREQSDTVFDEPFPMLAWPDVRTEYLLCRDDHLFPADWNRRLVQDRLGITPVEIPGSHCAYLSQPAVIADHLHSFSTDLRSPTTTT